VVFSGGRSRERSQEGEELNVEGKIRKGGELMESARNELGL
jgi:hypothetical protein